MANPPVLMCDADALYQLFIADQIASLRHLRDKYGIQPAVAEEVDLDIRSNQKLQKGIGAEFKKALGNGLLLLLDATRFNGLPALPNHTTFADIQTRGKRYNLIVGRGEAYSHAAGFCMGVPVMSNDWNAIQTLSARGYELPTPILRSFDLVCFGFQTGVITQAQCDEFRKKLHSIGEHMPKAFQNASFVDGLERFTPRLSCNAKNRIGRTPNPGAGFDQVLGITPK